MTLQQVSRELACLMHVTRRQFFHISLVVWKLAHAVHGAADSDHLSTMGWSLQECASSTSFILHILAVKLSDTCRLSSYTSLANPVFIEKDLNLEHTFSFITQIHSDNLFKFNPFSRTSLS